jgi:hypothetical protein
MNTRIFRRIASAAESNDSNAIKSLIKLSLRDDWYGELSRQQLQRLGVQVTQERRNHATA